MTPPSDPKPAVELNLPFEVAVIRAGTAVRTQARKNAKGPPRHTCADDGLRRV